MTVLERSELQASPLADLHAIADQLGLDGFRRLRKAELIDAILAGADDPSRGARVSAGGSGEVDEGAVGEHDSGVDEQRAARPRRRRLPRPRRSTSASKADSGQTPASGAAEPASASGAAEPASASEAAGPASGPARLAAAPSSRVAGQDAAEDGPRVAHGVVELLGNGSAFLRVSPPEPSDEDVYISATQVRRCELVSGDQVSGPIRTPRRSERYPSLVRIDTINGASADAVSGGTRYEDLPLEYPSERLALSSEDPTLQAIEWLTPLGRGSRAVIIGAPRAGKTETLRSLLAAVSGREDLQVSLVLTGARPEEIASWQEGPVQPAAALSFAASADSQGQAVERAVDAAKRVAARGGHALVLIDSLDGMHPHAARKSLAAARSLRDGGSLTIIATATRPFGGETTVIALDVALTSTGRQPILDLVASGTLKPELLVGEDGARAITRARASALETAI
jgi:transcription termination factor Rho